MATASTTQLEERARCLYSGQSRAVSGMLPYGDGWVAPENAGPWVVRVLETGEDSRDEEVFVGLRRRGLALAIDFLVKLIPLSVVNLPYYFAATDFREQVVVSGAGDVRSLVSVGFVVAMLLAKVGQTVISAGYETWMVGRYGATLGKMAIGARVTDPDGARLTYGRALLRWAAKSLLNGLIFWTILGLPLALAAGLLALAVARGGDVAGLLPLALWGGVAAVAVFVPLSLFPYWMATTDPEKRSLHDRVAGSRVRDADGTNATEEGKRS